MFKFKFSAYTLYLEDTLFNAIYLTELDIVFEEKGTISTAQQFIDVLISKITELPTSRPQTRPISNTIELIFKDPDEDIKVINEDNRLVFITAKMTIQSARTVRF